jgi:hypothetical protein
MVDNLSYQQNTLLETILLPLAQYLDMTMVLVQALFFKCRMMSSPGNRKLDF